MRPRIVEGLRTAARDAGLYALLLVAAAALFFLAFNLSNANVLVILAAGAVFGSLVTLFIAARTRSTPTAHGTSQAVTTHVTPTVLVHEIRAAALVSYAQIGSVNVRKERNRAAQDNPIKPLHDALRGEELLMDVGVRVIAGVNLKHLRESDVHIDPVRRAVEITLPPAKVLMVYVDESLTRVVAHKTGWFSARDIRLMDAARRDAMETMVHTAIEGGLLDKAGQQAAATVTAIARGLGFEQVTVRPTLPPIGQHYEELLDAAAIAKLEALPSPVLARDDQAGD
ncbi:MAG: DUF4230 domain-containing protein [Anaerolineae bacterium]|nr:DUF4230 domain-containing protein [Thermoflexales bacterium]MDW8407604.1 DUF4230 domain-containing protein [Anaerolineae bacterium]